MLSAHLLLLSRLSQLSRLLRAFAALAIGLVLSGCSGGIMPHGEVKAAERAQPPALSARLAPPRPTVASPSTVALRGVDFSRLPRWQDDRASRALMAFGHSCRRWQTLPDDQPLGETTLGGRVGDWRAACNAALALLADGAQDAEARQFFERSFEPFEILGEGTFTGYFEAQLMGSLRQTADYPVPIYRLPAAAADWMANPGQGPDRRALESGAVPGLEPLLFLRDAADAFTLHVQGSALVTLPDGRSLRLGYAGNNGHRFGSILGAMEAAGYDSAAQGKTWQAMVAWLKAHPDAAQEALYANPRFIFFKPSNPEAATGALGLPLTAGRSLAVDPAFIPLGVPLFLDSDLIYQGQTVPLQRLMVAQDTGNAIKGVVRGDVYWGSGPGAMELAGKMKQRGRYFILLPKQGRR